MFDPPTKENWVNTGYCHSVYTETYTEGYEAAKSGLELSDNPYKESGHERDTTYEDEMNYYWYCGFSDFSEGDLL